MPSAGAEASPEFRIFETDEFQQSRVRLGAPPFLPKKLTTYVHPQLWQSPHVGPNIRKLQGYVPATWRYRIGPYRLFDTVDDDARIVFLLTIDHRKDAYR